MKPGPNQCTYFDTPEGRWVLISEFTTEGAANQFMPQLAKDISADDLCSGASCTANGCAGSTTSGPSSMVGLNGLSMSSDGRQANGGLSRFGSASAGMASGGLMFPSSFSSAPVPATRPQSTQSSAAGISSGDNNASLAKSYMHTAANRPTHVSIFHSPIALSNELLQGQQLQQQQQQRPAVGGISSEANDTTRSSPVMRLPAIDEDSNAAPPVIPAMNGLSIADGQHSDNQSMDARESNTTESTTSSINAATPKIIVPAPDTHNGKSTPSTSRKNSFMRGWRSSNKDKTKEKEKEKEKVGATTGSPTTQGSKLGDSPASNGNTAAGSNDAPIPIHNSNSSHQLSGIRHGSSHAALQDAANVGVASDPSLAALGKGHSIRQGIFGLGKSISNSSTGTGSNSAHSGHGKGIITKSSSAYVSRIITNENIARWIMNDSKNNVFLMFNAPHCMAWVGLQPDSMGETLTRFDLVRNTPLCHDINQFTRGENRLDVIMGFVQGNIIWYEPISGKYTRLNKNTGYSPAIVCAKWIPGSSNLFVVGTADGGIMIMDRTKDDFNVPGIAFSDRIIDNMATFFAAHSNKPKSNPVAYWKVSNKPITNIAFSPDSRHVAVTCEDGGLRIIDYLDERLEDVYLSYFGGLSCVAWSADGQYIIAGGKDDLVTIWSYYDKAIVARCEGHDSWVRDVAFDPMCRAEEEEGTYRFMTVGEDAKLLVWDFSLTALHHPRIPAHRVGSYLTTSTSIAATPASSVRPIHLCGKPSIQDTPSDIVHNRMPKDSVAVLQPIMAEEIHSTSLCELQFSNDLLVTVCRKGIVKVWKRPAQFDLSSFTL